MRRTTLSLLGLTLLAASCTISKVEPPPLGGPSELGLSLQLTANPDVLRQDGSSQSLIRIQARGPNGDPARSVALRAEITVGGSIVDFGRLSTKNVVTDNNGQATLVYTAPPFVGDPVDEGLFVTIVVTPAESDNRNATARQLDIRLVPPGVVFPSNTPPVARFTYSPTAASVGQAVTFDATASSDADGAVVSYQWSFGDGTTGSGRVASHAYMLTGIYNVTLIVIDDRSAPSEPVTQTVNVASSALPSASFTFSPASPAIHQEIVFNAAASRAAPGRTLVRYDWNFGSGSPKEGVEVTKSYDVPGIYNVTLTVTDDIGQKSTVTQSVSVSTTSGQTPVATFTFSPTNPTIGVPVNFNASASAAPGSTIVAYDWDFGDGATGTGQTTTHTYTSAFSYVVRLTVRDSSGRTGTTTNFVTVTAPVPPAGPTAQFVVSKTGGLSIVADASASSSPSGSTPLTYRFSWGDGNATPAVGSQASPTASHTYTIAGTYTITMTVTDSGGRSASTTQTVTVP